LNWTHRTLAVLLLALSLAATAAQAQDPPGRVGRLRSADGPVWLTRSDGSATLEHPRESLRNWPVSQGDRLRTGHGARAEIDLGSTRLRLDEDSALRLEQVDDDHVVLQLDQGGLALVLQDPDVAREFRIDTAAGRHQPLGPGSFRFDARQEDRDDFSATAWRSPLRIEQDDATLTLRPGQRAEWTADGGWRRTLPAADAFARWALVQDDAPATPDPASTEMTGVDQLRQHGDWNHTADWGWLWTPQDVGPGWAPYREGRWAWVAPWGWTWIDDLPWGFAPFHYGRWVWWRDRWNWAPGARVARVVYAPALVAWSGTPGVSWSIRIGSGVRWHPLAPREVYVPVYRSSLRHVRELNQPHGVDAPLWQRAAERPDEVRQETRFRYGGFAPGISQPRPSHPAPAPDRRMERWPDRSPDRPADRPAERRADPRPPAWNLPMPAPARELDDRRGHWPDPRRDSRPDERRASGQDDRQHDRSSERPHLGPDPRRSSRGDDRWPPRGPDRGDGIDGPPRAGRPDAPPPVQRGLPAGGIVALPNPVPQPLPNPMVGGRPGLPEPLAPPAARPAPPASPASAPGRGPQRPETNTGRESSRPVRPAPPHGDERR
jgi:FecR protein